MAVTFHAHPVVPDLFLFLFGLPSQELLRRVVALRQRLEIVPTSPVRLSSPGWRVAGWGTPCWGTPCWGAVSGRDRTSSVEDVPGWDLPGWCAPCGGSSPTSTPGWGTPGWGTPGWGTPGWGTPCGAGWSTPGWSAPKRSSPKRGSCGSIERRSLSGGSAGAAYVLRVPRMRVRGEIHGAVHRSRTPRGGVPRRGTTTRSPGGARSVPIGVLLAGSTTTRAARCGSSGRAFPGRAFPGRGSPDGVAFGSGPFLPKIKKGKFMDIFAQHHA